MGLLAVRAGGCEVHAGQDRALDKLVQFAQLHLGRLEVLRWVVAARLGAPLKHAAGLDHGEERHLILGGVVDP
eukprot:8234511-Alexandrium_andersonii.AAC.1